MNDEEYKYIFSKNLKHYMKVNDKTQVDLINDLGFNKSAVSTWYNGTRLPRMDKIDKIADYFKINRSDLLEDSEWKKGKSTPKIDTLQKIADYFGINYLITGNVKGKANNNYYKIPAERIWELSQRFNVTIEYMECLMRGDATLSDTYADKEIISTIEKRVLARMEILNLSYNELNRRLDITEPYYEDILRRIANNTTSHITKQQLVALANALETSIEYLLGQSEIADINNQTLSIDETELLSNFRQLNTENKNVIQKYIKFILSEQKD